MTQTFKNRQKYHLYRYDIDYFFNHIYYYYCKECGLGAIKDTKAHDKWHKENNVMTLQTKFFETLTCLFGDINGSDVHR